MKKITTLFILITCLLLGLKSYSKSYDYIFNTFNVLNSLKINSNTESYFKSAYSDETAIYYYMTYDSINKTIKCETELWYGYDDYFLYQYSDEGLLKEIQYFFEDSIITSYKFHYSGNLLDSITYCHGDSYSKKLISLILSYDNKQLVSKMRLTKNYFKIENEWSFENEVIDYEESYQYTDGLLSTVIHISDESQHESIYSIEYNGNNLIKNILLQYSNWNQPKRNEMILKRDYSSGNSYVETINRYPGISNVEDYVIYKDLLGRDTLIYLEERNFSSHLNYNDETNIYTPPLPDYFNSFLGGFVVIFTKDNIYKFVKGGLSRINSYSYNESTNSHSELIEYVSYQTTFFEIPLNIENYRNENKIKIFPNPVFDVFKIDGLRSNSATIKLFDVYGRVQFTSKHDEIEQIDISTLKNGIYIVTAEDKKGLFWKTRIIKK